MKRACSITSAPTSAQWLTIGVPSAFVIVGILRNEAAFAVLNKRIDSLEQRVNNLERRMDETFIRLESKIDKLTARVDLLYDRERLGRWLA